MYDWLHPIYLRIKPWLPTCLINAVKKIYFQVSLRIYKREVEKRKRYSVFDYVQLAEDMSLVTREYGYNAFYGTADMIKYIRQLPLDQPLDGIVEHGFCLPPDDISEVDKPKKTIYVMGSVRQKFLQKRFPDKKIYSVGPYIQYMAPFHSATWIQTHKKQMGKTLLVFPSHSTHHVSMEFCVDSLLDEIERIRKKYDFQTVLVCLYWKDILLHLDSPFSAKGYKIVTAGHIYDPQFLCRLKSIFLLADVAMGNALGTNIGYSIAMGVPYYFYDMPVQYRGEHVDESNKEMVAFKALIQKYLGEYRENITPEIQAFIEAYWGSWTVDTKRKKIF